MTTLPPVPAGLHEHFDVHFSVRLGWGGREVADFPSREREKAFETPFFIPKMVRSLDVEIPKTRWQPEECASVVYDQQTYEVRLRAESPASSPGPEHLSWNHNPIICR